MEFWKNDWNFYSGFFEVLIIILLLFCNFKNHKRISANGSGLIRIFAKEDLENLEKSWNFEINWSLLIIIFIIN